MTTIWKLRGRWQAQVHRHGMKPHGKSFDTKQRAEKWARDLEVGSIASVPHRTQRSSRL